MCKKCEKPKVNEKYFPNISPEAYWTQTQNKLNKKMYWTVNFMTGHNYSRFFAYQQLPVLLVQDRDPAQVVRVIAGKQKTLNNCARS